MSDFLDDQALESNEKSTIKSQNLSIVMRLEHPTLPHAAALCLESRELLIVGRANGLISIAYFKAIEDDLVFSELVRDRRISFENVGYVKKMSDKPLAYSQLRQLPVSLYSSAAKLAPLKFIHQRPGGKLFNITLNKANVRIPSSKGGHVTVACPTVCGEMLIDHEAKPAEFTSFDQGIDIQGDRIELRLIDRALLAAISFIEWS